jgi:hypothetical protein
MHGKQEMVNVGLFFHGGGCSMISSAVSGAAPAAAAITTSAATAGGASAPPALGLGASLVYVQRSSLEFFAIQALNCGLRLIARVHLCESKTFGSTSGSIVDNGYGFNFPELAQRRP